MGHGRAFGGLAVADHDDAVGVAHRQDRGGLRGLDLTGPVAGHVPARLEVERLEHRREARRGKQGAERQLGTGLVGHSPPFWT